MQRLAIITLGLFLLLLPAFSGSPLVSTIMPAGLSGSALLNVFLLIFLFAYLAQSWNILGGFAGQLSLGHAAFFGIGAYTSTLLFIDLGISPWIGMVIGGALATLVSGAIGYPSFRLRGPFFTLVTIAFAEVVRLLTLYAHDLTRGSIGISVPFRPAAGNFIFRQVSAY